ncbi:hypothetical protein JCM11251_001426 [Rhodosporidiobolus azoricus]
MEADDPILDTHSQSLFPYSTPQETIESAQRKSESGPKSKSMDPPPAPRSYHEQKQQKQGPPKAPYVPKFDRGKGKARAYESTQEDPFHRATSFKQNADPTAMLLDDTVESFPPITATKHGKRRSSEGENEESDGYGAGENPSSAKRPKRSEGEEGIEV